MGFFSANSLAEYEEEEVDDDEVELSLFFASEESEGSESCLDEFDVLLDVGFWDGDLMVA